MRANLYSARLTLVVLAGLSALTFIPGMAHAQDKCNHLGQPVICPPGVTPGSTSLFFIGPPANNNIRWNDGSTTNGINPRPFPVGGSSDSTTSDSDSDNDTDANFFQNNFFRNGQGDSATAEEVIQNLLDYGFIVPITAGQLERIKKGLNSNFSRAISTAGHNRHMENSYRESAETYRDNAKAARDRAKQWRELAENQEDPEVKKRYLENAETLEQDAADWDERAEAEDTRADEYAQRANAAEGEAEGYFDQATETVLKEDMAERQQREAEAEVKIKALTGGTTTATTSSTTDDSRNTDAASSDGTDTAESNATPPPSQEQSLEELRLEQWQQMQTTRENTVRAINEIKQRIKRLESQAREPGRSHLQERANDEKRKLAGREASLEYADNRIQNFQDKHYDGDPPPGASSGTPSPVATTGTGTPANPADQAGPSTSTIISHNQQDNAIGTLIDGTAEYGFTTVTGQGAGAGSISPAAIKTIYDLGQSAQQVVDEAPAMNQAIIDAMDRGDVTEVKRLQVGSFRRAVQTMFDSSGAAGYGSMFMDFLTGGN